MLFSSKSIVVSVERMTSISGEFESQQAERTQFIFVLNHFLFRWNEVNCCYCNWFIRLQWFSFTVDDFIRQEGERWRLCRRQNTHLRIEKHFWILFSVIFRFRFYSFISSIDAIERWKATWIEVWGEFRSSITQLTPFVNTFGIIFLHFLLFVWSKGWSEKRDEKKQFFFIERGKSNWGIVSSCFSRSLTLFTVTLFFLIFETSTSEWEWEKERAKKSRRIKRIKEEKIRLNTNFWLWTVRSTKPDEWIEKQTKERRDKKHAQHQSTSANACVWARAKNDKLKEKGEKMWEMRK